MRTQDIPERCSFLRRIRVLEVLRPALGGMKKHVQGLIQGLDKDRFEVFLAAPEDEVARNGYGTSGNERTVQWSRKECVEHIPLEISGRILAPGDAFACLRLRNIIKAVGPDICHFHGFKAAAVGRVAVATSSGPKVVYTAHNSVLSRSSVELSHPRHFTDCSHNRCVPETKDSTSRGSIPEDSIPKGIFRQDRIFQGGISQNSVPTGSIRTDTVSSLKYVSRLCNPYPISLFQGMTWFQRTACLYIERVLARFTHRVIAVSKSLYEEYSDIPGLGPEKVRYIPNGIHLEAFSRVARLGDEERKRAKRKMGCARDAPVIGVVARLIPHKGVQTFLRAVVLLREAGFLPEVLIAGDGPSRDELEALSRELGLGGRVRFLGFVEDMASFYAALDLFVLPSLSEGMPLALLEAMAAGVPIVATRTGGIKDLILTAEDVVNLDSARLVPPGDPLAMATCIQRALLCPHESRALADKARSHILRNFSIERMVRRTEEVYEEVLACRS
jgi:glycosyltransferase involved in cell wall biosynthesis